MANKTQSLSFKKSVLSIVIISTITGGLIAVDKYQMKPQSFELSEDKVSNALLENSMGTADVQELTLIAQANALPEEPVEAGLQQQHFESENETPAEASQLLVEVEDKHMETSLQASGSKQEVIEYELLFAFDSSEIAPSYYSSLNKTAERMKTGDNNRQIVWQVVGYADPTGNALYNHRLAQKRAQAVAEFLIDKGVNKEQLAIVSLGERHAQPLSVDKEKSHLQRRVAIHAYQAEIAALAEQLNPVQEALPPENNDGPEIIQPEITETLSTAMTF